MLFIIPPNVGFRLTQLHLLDKVNRVVCPVFLQFLHPGFGLPLGIFALNSRYTLRRNTFTRSMNEISFRLSFRCLLNFFVVLGGGQVYLFSMDDCLNQQPN